MNTTTTTTMTAQISYLKAAYYASKEHFQLRGYFKAAMSAGIEFMNARGIQEKFETRYQTWLEGTFFNPDADNFIGSLIPNQQVEKFEKNVRGWLNDHYMKDAIVKSLNKVLDRDAVKIEEVTAEDIEVETLPDIKIENVKSQTNGHKVETNGHEIPAAKVPAPVIEAGAPTKVEMKKETATAAFSLNIPLTEMIDSAVHNYIENESGLLAHVDKRIEEEAMKLRPNQIKIGERPVVEIKGKLHKEFKLSLQLLQIERQIFIAGPAGTGKTTLAEQCAKAMNLKFAHISCTQGMSEAHLLGRMNANGEYLMAAFVDVYENGGVFLFDEIDAADGNTLLIINSALANGHMSVPNRVSNPTAKRHPEFYCVAAANTWGFGSNEYVGRNILDGAFLDRFAGSRLSVDYDKELEKEISAQFPQVAEAVWMIRQNVAAARIRRVVSTRAIISGVRQLAAGFTLKQYIDRFMCGWSEEEKKKAIQNVKF